MTNSQQYKATATLHWHAPVAGELVACDRLWLTRQGDLDDHVLQAGERVHLVRGDDVVVEALPGDRLPRWDWQPAEAAPPSWRDRLVAGLRRVQFGAHATRPGCSA